MTRVVLDINAARLQNALTYAPETTRKALQRVLLRTGITMENAMARGRFRPYQGGGRSTLADRLQRRSGSLQRAFAFERPEVDKLDMRLGFRSGQPGGAYARLQEFGGTIKPKRGQYLTIPTEEALTPSGILSGKYMIRKSGDRYVTDAGETFIFKSRGGNLLIGIKGLKRPNGEGPPRQVALSRGRGDAKELKVFYVLRRSVKVPARLGFFKTWKTIQEGLLPKLLEREVFKAFRGGPGGVL
jgi:hypothetical protein